MVKYHQKIPFDFVFFVFKKILLSLAVIQFFGIRRSWIYDWQAQPNPFAHRWTCSFSLLLRRQLLDHFFWVFKSQFLLQASSRIVGWLINLPDRLLPHLPYYGALVGYSCHRTYSFRPTSSSASSALHLACALGARLSSWSDRWSRSRRNPSADLSPSRTLTRHSCRFLGHFWFWRSSIVQGWPL